MVRINQDFFDRVSTFAGTVDALARPHDRASLGLSIYRTVPGRVMIMYSVPGMTTPDKMKLMRDKLAPLALQLCDEFPEARVVFELQGWNVFPTITVMES